MISDTPKPPYYAVIFTSFQDRQLDGYTEMLAELEELVKQQPGFLGLEATRNDLGITVSYWQDEASITAWKNQVYHKAAQKLGREKWYQQYKVRVCKVERDYEFLTDSQS